MPTLTLTDLSTHCLSAIEVALAGHEVAVIDAEGRPRFVVMGVQRYRELLADEAVAALAQGGADLAAGRCVAESAAAHVARLEGLLQGQAPDGALRRSAVRRGDV